MRALVYNIDDKGKLEARTVRFSPVMLPFVVFCKLWDELYWTEWPEPRNPWLAVLVNLAKANRILIKLALLLPLFLVRLVLLAVYQILKPLVYEGQHLINEHLQGTRYISDSWD